MNEQAQRQSYQVIKKAYSQLNKKNPVTTSSDLVLIVPIAAGKTSYTFPVIVGEDPNNYPDAILLDRADAFTAVSIGLGIGLKSTANDGAYSLFTYPNAAEFSTSADSFKAVYNSLLNMTIDNVQYLQNFSTKRMLFQPIQQNGSALYDAAPYTEVDNVKGDADGLTPLVPTLQLNGGSKTNITIQLPSALTPVSGSVAVLVLTLRGFLSLGASKFKY